MSVIPQEENLVLTFAEATRVFNTQQSNTGTFVPGTGDTGNQAPTNSYLSNSNEPSYSNNAGYPAFLSRASRAQRESQSQRPFGVAEGLPAVVPPTMPSREDVANNPEKLVDIRSPATGAGAPMAGNENGGPGGVGEYYDEDEEHYSNPWFATRSWMRVYFAEFLGTLVLVLWGEGTQAQVIAARKQPGDYLSVAWGWGVGFMLAIYISSGISGGHINPAVTVSLAVFRRFKWRKVPGYVLAQLLGAFTAAAIIYGVYYGPLHSLEGGYASVMTTGPADLVSSTASAFFSVFIGAALLMGSISAFTDTGNNPATPGLTPLLLGLVMVGIASSFGYQTGFVLNPARDLGPRLLVWATGAGGRALWLDNSAYGIWIPTVATTTGACFGNFVYDLLIYNGRDSPLNTNFSRRAKRARAQCLKYEKDQESLHAGQTGHNHPHGQQAMVGAPAERETRFSGSTFNGGRAEEEKVFGGKTY